MNDIQFEHAVVNLLIQRGWVCTKLDPVEVEFEGTTIEAFTLPEAPQNRLESRFDEFWALYPRKTGKEAARKIFEKLTHEQQNRVFEGLRLHLNAEAFSSEKCYIKHPSTWLNQKVYLDDPEPRNWRKPQIGGKTQKRKALDDWLND